MRKPRQILKNNCKALAKDAETQTDTEKQLQGFRTSQRALTAPIFGYEDDEWWLQVAIRMQIFFDIVILGLGYFLRVYTLSERCIDEYRALVGAY